MSLKITFTYVRHNIGEGGRCHANTRKYSNVDKPNW
jgi:hypothetical protein